MSSASINDQVRRTVLHHCFQCVRSGTAEQLAKWDAVLEHFNIHAPKKEEVMPTTSTADGPPPCQHQDGVVCTASIAAPITTSTTTPSRDQMQRLGRKLSQMATKMYGLSVDALNNTEMFFVCVILDLKEFSVPTPTPTLAPAVVVSSTPPSLYMDDDIATPPPPTSAVAEVVVVVPAAAVKIPTKRALQVILESFHYSKNPLPERVRRAPEVLVYDPPIRVATKNKVVPKKTAAATAAVEVPAAVAIPPVLGTKRDRAVEKKQSKLTTVIKELKPSSSLPKAVPTGTVSSRPNKNARLPPTPTPAHQQQIVPIHNINNNSTSLMMSNLLDSSSSYCSTSDDDSADSVTETEVMSGGLTVNRQDVFDFKQKKGISALAEDVDYGDDPNDEEDTPEGRRRRKQLKLVEVLRLEGMLTTEIALKVLNSGAGKGGKKATAAAGGGDPPATAADVAAHFEDIIRRGFAVRDFDDTIFLCS